MRATSTRSCICSTVTSKSPEGSIVRTSRTTCSTRSHPYASSGCWQLHALLTARRIFSSSKGWVVTPSRLRIILIMVLVLLVSRVSLDPDAEPSPFGSHDPRVLAKLQPIHLVVEGA